MTGGSIVAPEPFYEPDAFLNGINWSLQGFSGQSRCVFRGMRQSACAVALARTGFTLLDGAMAKQHQGVTCGHCRLPIEPGDIVVEFDNAATIHVRCWRVDESEMLSRASDLVRRSRELIETSRGRIDQTNSCSPSRATAHFKKAPTQVSEH